MTHSIGIDLGTTNSCVAVMEGGAPVVIPGADGSRTTPSAVAFTKNGERLVGMPARRQAATNPGGTFLSVKRRMGSGERFRANGRSYTPEELSAMILGKLKTDAERYLGCPVTDAVITVPAYFTDAQRQATKDAGQIAGLNVRRILNEPTAAALAYGLDRGEPRKILVCDLGGGTFDVSVLDSREGVIEVLATAGNNRLGGDDYDRLVADWLAAEFRRREKIDPRRDPVCAERLRAAAEQAKIELSELRETTVSLPFLWADKSGPRSLEVTLTREKLEELTASLTASLRPPIEQAISDAGIWVSELSDVLMVGGAGRMPAVLHLVRELTGIEPTRGINPDECVAMGAAVQSGVLDGTVRGLLLLDVMPLSLGIETMGDRFTRIIDRNTAIPIMKSQVFTTAAPYQSSVDIHVLQGERERASGNRTLGKFRLTGIRRAMAGVPKIEVTFDVDANGIVHVSARDLGTGKAQEVTITASGHLSDAEIAEAVSNAARFDAEDARRRETEEARAEAEELLREAAARGRCCDHRLKAALRESSERLREAIRKGSASDIASAAEALRAAMTAAAPGKEQDSTDEDDE